MAFIRCNWSTGALACLCESECTSEQNRLGLSKQEFSVLPHPKLSFCMWIQRQKLNLGCFGCVAHPGWHILASCNICPSHAHGSHPSCHVGKKQGVGCIDSVAVLFSLVRVQFTSRATSKAPRELRGAELIPESWAACHTGERTAPVFLINFYSKPFWRQGGNFLPFKEEPQVCLHLVLFKESCDKGLIFKEADFSERSEHIIIFIANESIIVVYHFINYLVLGRI